MKKLSKKKHTGFGSQYVRYLLSYMVILMIPLFILTFFYTSRFMKKFYQEIYETVDSELVQLGIQIESEWISMEKIVGQLALNGTIRQTANAEHPIDLNPAISELSGFSTANSFITDIALIMDDQDYVVTSSTTVQKDYYFNRILQLPDASEDALERLLSSPAPVCLPSQSVINRILSSDAKNTMLIAFPLFTDYQKKEGTILFSVPDLAIQKLLNQKLQSYQSQIYILDQNGTILSTSGPSPDAIFAENDEYIIRSYQSPGNQWSYYAYLPNRQDTFSQVSSIINEFLAAIIITLFLASFAIYVLQKINYSPLRKLMNAALKISPAESSSDEFATISHALDYLSVQNTSLSSQLSGSLSAIKNERIYRLLNGKYASRQDFNLDCSELDLYLPHGYFSIGIIMFHQKVENLEAIALEIKKQFAVPYTYYYLHTFHPSQLVFLVNVTDYSAPLEQFFGDTQAFLSEQYHLSTTMGIGTAVDNTERIAQSYMEASSALDYRFVKGNGTIILFREILGSTQSAVVYPQEEFGILRNALRSHNEQSIRSTVQNIITFMEENPMPLYLARSVCFDLIHLVNGYYHSQNPASERSPMELSGMETAQEIIQMLHLWSEAWDSSTVTTASSSRAMIEEVLSYLDANCLNCDFSAYETAEHFHMTLPAFSKFFKEATGQNVMDYTIQARIQKAKDLLTSTNLPLKDISEQVGYYNVSSFTRRFKLNQGVTPGEYRKLSAKNA